MDEAQLTKFMKAAREGKLSTRDRKMLNSFALTPEEHLADMEDSISANSLAELTRAIDTAPTSAVRDVLLEAKDKQLRYATMKGQKMMEEAQTAKIPPSFMEHLGSLLHNLFAVPR